ALGDFYDQYNKLVFSFALKILNSREEAEEVTLEVFWQAWQQADQYTDKRGSVGAWLVMMTRSRAIDRRRARERRNLFLEAVGKGKNVPDPNVSFDPEKSIYWLERRDAIVKALAEMNDKQRQAIELAYFSGLSQSEIAEKLQEPLGTVKTRIRAAVQLLREK